MAAAIPQPRLQTKIDLTRRPASEMRVLHLTYGFPPQIGGVETFVADLTAWQVANGSTVTVITGSTKTDPDDICIKGVQVYRLPYTDVLTRQDLNGIAAIRRKISSIVDDFAPEIVHLHPVAAEIMFMRDFVRTTSVPVGYDTSRRPRLAAAGISEKSRNPC